MSGKLVLKFLSTNLQHSSDPDETNVWLFFNGKIKIAKIAEKQSDFSTWSENITIDKTPSDDLAEIQVSDLTKIPWDMYISFFYEFILFISPIIYYSAEKYMDLSKNKKEKFVNVSGIIGSAKIRLNSFTINNGKNTQTLKLLEEQKEVGDILVEGYFTSNVASNNNANYHQQQNINYNNNNQPYNKTPMNYPKGPPPPIPQVNYSSYNNMNSAPPHIMYPPNMKVMYIPNPNAYSGQKPVYMNNPGPGYGSLPQNHGFQSTPGLNYMPYGNQNIAYQNTVPMNNNMAYVNSQNMKPQNVGKQLPVQNKQQHENVKKSKSESPIKIQKEQTIIQKKPEKIKEILGSEFAGSDGIIYNFMVFFLIEIN